jgi:hypothetical protein
MKCYQEFAHGVLAMSGFENCQSCGKVFTTQEKLPHEFRTPTTPESLANAFRGEF